MIFICGEGGCSAIGWSLEQVVCAAVVHFQGKIQALLSRMGPSQGLQLPQMTYCSYFDLLSWHLWAEMWWRLCSATCWVLWLGGRPSGMPCHYPCISTWYGWTKRTWYKVCQWSPPMMSRFKACTTVDMAFAITVCLDNAWMSLLNSSNLLAGMPQECAPVISI